MNYGQCDSVIFKNGIQICYFDSPSWLAESYIQKVREDSNQQVDWHYSCGIVNVLYIGNYNKVKKSLLKFKPYLDKEYSKYCLNSLNINLHKIYYYRIYENKNSLIKDSYLKTIKYYKCLTIWLIMIIIDKWTKFFNLLK